jgi:hypothetical protein
MMEVVDSHLIDSEEKDQLPLLRNKYGEITTNQELKEAYKTILSGGDYRHKASAYKKFVDTERIEAAVNAIFDNSNIYKGYTEEEKKKRKEDMLDYYTSKLGTQIETDLKQLSVKDSTSDDPNAPGNENKNKPPLFTGYTKDYNDNKEELNKRIKGAWNKAAEAGDKTVGITASLQALKELTDITHEIDSKGRIVGKIPKTEDASVDKTVNDVNFLYNGNHYKPQALANELWKSHQTELMNPNSKEFKTFKALTGQSPSIEGSANTEIKQDKNGNIPINRNNSFGYSGVATTGNLTNIERIDRVPVYENGQIKKDSNGQIIYQDVTTDYALEHPDYAESPNTKHVYRAYFRPMHNTRMYQDLVDGNDGGMEWQEGDKLAPTGGADAFQDFDLSVSREVNAMNQLMKSTSGLWEKAKKSGAIIVGSSKKKGKNTPKVKN